MRLCLCLPRLWLVAHSCTTHRAAFHYLLLQKMRQTHLWPHAAPLAQLTFSALSERAATMTSPEGWGWEGAGQVEGKGQRQSRVSAQIIPVPKATWQVSAEHFSGLGVCWGGGGSTAVTDWCRQSQLVDDAAKFAYYFGLQLRKTTYKFRSSSCLSKCCSTTLIYQIWCYRSHQRACGRAQLDTPTAYAVQYSR